MTLTQRVQAKLVRDFRRAHRVRQILLVGEHQQHRVSEFVFVQHAVQLVARLGDAIAIVTVDDENQTLRVLEVMSPQRANLILSTDVPNRERNVFILDGFDVKPDGRNRRDDLPQLELVKNRRLTRGIETNLGG